MPPITRFFAPTAPAHAWRSALSTQAPKASQKLQLLSGEQLKALSERFTQAAPKSQLLNSEKGHLPFSVPAPSEMLQKAGGSLFFASQPPEGPNEIIEAKSLPGAAESLPHPSPAANTPSPTPRKALANGPHSPAKMAERAQEAVRKMTEQKQTFMARLFGPQSDLGDMRTFLGPNITFEDALVALMMKIAHEEEKDILQKTRELERGNSGLNAFMRKRGKDVGGILGGALGGWVGGVSGASVGQDIGERLVTGYTGTDTPESRQLQFEKLKHQMQKLNEMMQAVSNMVSSNHRTALNSIGNLRA